jgi:hypothetical protein
MSSGLRLPHDLETALRSQMAHVRWGGVTELIRIADNNSELSTTAIAWLAHLRANDPAPRIRAAAQKYFDHNPKALSSADRLDFARLSSLVHPQQEWFPLENVVPGRTMAGGLSIGVGVAASALMFYPLYVNLPAQYVKDWLPASNLIGGILVFLSLAFIVGGSMLTIWWSGERSHTGAISTGIRTGVIAGSIMFMLLGAGAAGVMGMRDILEHGPSPANSERHMIQLILDAVTRIGAYTLISFWLANLGGGLLGAIGSLPAFIRYLHKPRQVTLDDDRINLLIISPIVALFSTTLCAIVGMTVYGLLPESINTSANKIGITPAFPADSLVNWVTYTMLIMYIASIIWLVLTIWHIGTHAQNSGQLRKVTGASRFSAILSILFALLHMLIWGTNIIELRLDNSIIWLSFIVGVLFFIFSFMLKQQARGRERAEQPFTRDVAKTTLHPPKIKLVDILLYILLYLLGFVVLVSLSFVVNSTFILICGLPILIAIPVIYELRFTRRWKEKELSQGRNIEGPPPIPFWFRNILHLGLSTGFIIWLPIFLLVAPALSLVLGVVGAIPVLSSYDPGVTVLPDQMFTSAGLVRDIFRSQAFFGGTSFLISVVVGLLLSLIIQGLISLLSPRPSNAR